MFFTPACHESGGFFVYTDKREALGNGDDDA